MFTVCPKCSLTLVVTAADLRVAQGYVRCGRCSNVFNALNALSDERGAEHQGPAPQHEHSARLDQSPPPQPAPDVLVQPDEAAEPVEPVEASEASEAEALPPSTEEGPEEDLEFDPTSTRVEEVFLAPPGEGDETTGTFESIVLEGDDGDEPESFDEVEEQVIEAPLDEDSNLEKELRSLALRVESESRSPARDFSSGAPTISRSAAETLQELGVTLSDEPSSADEESRVPAWLWRSAVAALALLLIAQAVHHYRSDLAIVAQLGEPLAAIYRALGISLEPRWDVQAYEVHQLGATSDPATANRLIVRASIKNAAARAQPLPLLRVAVQDRFGNRIASSDVAPAAYAPRAIATQARLASGQRLDIEMRFVDPGKEAVGFEIDACLAVPAGGVNCANH